MNPIEEQIESVVDSILEDYRNGRDIDKLDPTQQPDKAVVIDMIGKLMRILYPGATREKTYRIYNARHNLSMLIEDVMYNLNKQIAIVLRTQMPQKEAEERAQQVSLEFFRAIPKVRAMAQTDVQAFFDGDPAAFSIDEIIFCYPGLFAISVYRLAHVLYQQGVPVLPRIMTEHAHSITGIVIGETTVIGDHVKVYQGVTLGALTTRGGQSLRGKKRHPTIEDHVTIYAGASILGGGTVIGSNSVIGSNVFITHSIPACTTVSVKSQELQFKPRTCGGNCETCTKPEPFWEEQK